MLSLLRMILRHPLWRNPSMMAKKAGMLFPQTVSPQKHIFILGAPRSGTALLESLLLAHPAIGGFGYETAFFVPHDAAVFEENRMNRQEMQKILRASRDMVSFYDRLVMTMKERVQKNHWVEKTPQHVLSLRFLLKHFPKSRILHIYRDGRDCYCSAKNQPVLRSFRARSVSVYGGYWRKCIRTRLRERTAENILDVCYENLVQDPERTLRTVMGFLGEAFLEQQLQSRRQPVLHTPRLQEPISASSVRRYQKEMTLEEIKVFESIAARELKDLGYDLCDK